jgi:hypothetical protein
MLCCKQTGNCSTGADMGLCDVLLGMALISIGWGIVSAIEITIYVSEYGTKINYFLYRIYIIKYVSQYKQITQAEGGRPGPWFYSFGIV